MVYMQGDFTLFVKYISLKGTPGKKWPMYFFSKKQPKSGDPCDMPEGYVVKVNEKTGLPFLKKKE